jgi:hypothetical protein
MPTLICRNEILRSAAKNNTMSFDPSSDPESLGQKRPSLGTILSMFIVLAGIIAVIAILIAYGLVGTL